MGARGSANVRHEKPRRAVVARRGFLDGLRKLADQYPVVRLSSKQDSWLRGLCDDAGIANAP